MGVQFDEVAPEVQNHIRKLVKTAGLEETDESLEMLSSGWLEKQSSFFEQTKQKNMEEVETLELEDSRGALVMTYSGSLISIGPDVDGHRSVDYVSIGLRGDVPESAGDESAVLGKDIVLGTPLEFQSGPITKSSPAYAIAVFAEELEYEEETRALEEVTLMVTRDFLDINKTMIQE